MTRKHQDPKQPRRPKHLYRYFDVEEHAQAMLAGRVWVSTLDWCRKCDDLRMDPGEGTLSLGVTDAQQIFAGLPPEEQAERLTNLGIVGDLSTSNIKNIQLIRRIPDAFILCLSESKKLPRFGRFQVRIADPDAFIAELTNAMQAKFGKVTSRFDKLQYLPRKYVDEVSPREHPAFIGAVGNEGEAEWRACWIVEAPIERFELNVPAAGRFCSMA